MGSDMSNSHALGGSGRSAQRGIMESNFTNVGCETWHPLKIGKGQHESWSSIGANLAMEQGVQRCATHKKRLFCRWCRARTGKVVQECTRRYKKNVQCGSTIEGFVQVVEVGRIDSRASFLFRCAVWS